MSTGRRIGIAGVAITSMVAVGLAVAWAWWLPAQIRARVEEVAARRGLTSEIGGVSPGLGDVELTSVVLRHGDALELRAARVVVHAGVFELGTEGSGAARRVSVSQARATLRLDDAELAEALRALRGEVAAEADGASAGRHLSVEGLELLLRDSDGALVEATGGDVSLLPEGVLQGEIGPLTVARGNPDGADVERVSFRASRGEAGWQLEDARVEQTRVRYSEREGTERSPLWARLRRHAHLLAGVVGAEDEPTDETRSGEEETGAQRSAQHEGAANGSAQNGSAQNGSAEHGSAEHGSAQNGSAQNGSAEHGSAQNGSAQNGMAESGDTSGSEGHGDHREDGEGCDETANPASGGEDDEGGTLGAARWVSRALQGLGPRLPPGASLHLEDLAVVATSEEGERGVLEELDVDVQALPELGRYRLEGEGQPGRGGRLSWDLRVTPATLHAEGRVELTRLPFVLLVPLLPNLPWHEPEQARVTGQLRIEGSGVGRAHVSGRASVEDLALSSPRIAPQPVRRIAPSFDGEADWIAAERRLEVSRARLGLGRASVDVAGSLEWPEDHYLLHLTATLPPTDCNVAVGAIPADLLGELASFTFTGRLGGQVAAHVDSRDLDATQLSIRVANGCQFQTAPQLADVRRFEGPFTHRVVEPDGTTFEMETGPGTAAWTPIAQISPFFIHAVLGHEDAGFFGHGGFSTSSIRLALVRNLTAGRYVYGASTITMQLVKNVFLHREKTLARKVQEVLLTWWLESVMDKARILELYLNVIEYGPQVYGIRAAAQHYFGCDPADLGPAQSAYLATILPNPKAFHEHYEEDALPARHRRRVERFLRTLASRGRYDGEALAYGLARLETFDFHQPGEPVALPEVARGHTRPLPIDGVWTLDPWADEADDSDEEPFDEAPFDERWDAP